MATVRPTEDPIVSNVQLLVEGNDQRNFFEAMARHLKLPDIQFRNFGGVTELRGYLAGFVNMSNFRAAAPTASAASAISAAIAGAVNGSIRWALKCPRLQSRMKEE